MRDREKWMLKKDEGMPEHPPSPKLLLEKTEQIVYNHHRSNQRILSCPMSCTGN